MDGSRACACIIAAVLVMGCDRGRREQPAPAPPAPVGQKLPASSIVHEPEEPAVPAARPAYPGAGPAVTSVEPGEPEVEPEKKADTKVWIHVHPIQCMRNPWQRDWLVSEGTLEDWDPGAEAKVIKAYYAKNGIKVYRVTSKKIADGTCAGCQCSTGYRLGLLVDAASKGKIGKRGNIIGKPPEPEPVLKNVH